MSITITTPNTIPLASGNFCPTCAMTWKSVYCWACSEIEPAAVGDFSGNWEVVEKKKRVVSNPKVEVCWHWLNGECKYKDTCYKLHKDTRPICLHALKGMCKYGNHCYKKHP